MVEKKSGGSGKKIAAIASVAALGGAAAAGYYFFVSKSAKKNRRIAAKWAGDLKTDVVRQAKKVQDIDKKAFLQVVNTAAQAISSARNIDRREIERAARELKENWQQVLQEIGTRTSAAKKSLTGKPASGKKVSSVKRLKKVASKRS